MKKSICALLTLALVLMCQCTLLAKASPETLASMYAHPERYIAYGHVGSGFSVYLDRESLNVHQYEPPYYIIAINSVLHGDNGMLTNRQEFAGEPVMIRFRYDYSTKQMYQERYNPDTKQNYWDYIDPNASNKSTASGWEPAMSGAEIAFYLAYGMTFNNPPLGFYSQEFIKKGISRLPMIKLPGNGTHYYNHRQGKIITVK